MPIAALPTQTVRAIGSSQALTDSSSLVKELLDNAIDASATAIAVEISTNALDDIRVKDNGRGISPDDRPLICQRHCTSKIRDLDELRTIGGRLLGFRGVALASAAEMSGRLTIATRIEGEETASEMRFDRQGRIVRYACSRVAANCSQNASERRTSLPMGTTVRVENFLEALPVRRHTAEKFTSKTLAKIKKTLQAYALARPRLRLSLKVVKAKDEKANWKYPINAGNSKVETNSFSAAVDIMGKKLTNQCQWTRSVWCSSGQRIDSTSEVSEVENDQACNYTFEAVLAKQDCGMFAYIKTSGA